MPVVVSSQADGLSSKILDYSVRVFGSIRNDGGDGYVVVEATVFQGNDSWTKTAKIYLSSGTTGDYKIVFDEVRLLNKTPKFRVSCRSL
jgi:hypothetical protein